MRKRSICVGAIVGSVALVGWIGAVEGTPIPTLPRPGDFVSRIDNKYFPLKPGTTFLYRGTEKGKYAGSPSSSRTRQGTSSVFVRRSSSTRC
jgi:hypothetical protein